MGKWDHRPRRFFRRQRSPPPKIYHLSAPLPEFWQDGIPLWEKKYCITVGLVPWQKIVDSRKYEFLHSNVINWNDSAAEEAFQNAKKRYWAKINSFPCDLLLPDPDTYIEQIDWNPYIDPELVKELDNAFFTLPDEEQENAIQNKRTKTSVNGENPWERAGTPVSLDLENNKVRGWRQGDSGNMDNADNPWECITTGGNGGLTDNALEGGQVKSWRWNEEKDNDNHCKDWNSGYSQKDKGWGKNKITWDSSWSQQQSNNLVNTGNYFQCKSSQQNATPTNTGWRNGRGNVSGWKQRENTNVSSDLQFGRNYGGWTAQNQGYQWREGSNRHTFGYSSSQFQRDDHQSDHYWKREKSKKRDFVP